MKPTAITRLHEAIPWVFLVLALVASLLAAWTVPPFQVADENTHFYRAALITSGPRALSAQPSPDGPIVKGLVHQSIVEAYAPFDRMRGHPELRMRSSDLVAVEGIRLDARRVSVAPGLAFNPLLYAPSSAAVAWGRHFGWEVLDVLYLGRTLNAVASVAVGFLALRLAGTARLALFAVMMLPMSTALFGAMGQDGPMLALVALAAALLARGIASGQPLRRRELAIVAACVAMAAMAKAPLAVLAILVWLAPTPHRRVRLVAALLAAALPLAWNAGLTLSGWTPPPPPGMTTDAAGQARWLIDNIRALPALAIQTLDAYGAHYGEQFVGVLGSLDTRIWPRFYGWAYAMLALAAVGSVSFGAAPPWRRLQIATPLVIVAAGAGIFASLYIGWSNVGSPVVGGVQGRYFLPLALVLPLAFEGPKPLLSGGRLRDAAGAAAHLAVLIFPLVSIVVTQQLLIARYYLQ